MTNGSIMNGNINRFYHGEVNGNLNQPTMNVENEEGEKFEVPLPFWLPSRSGLFESV